MSQKLAIYRTAKLKYCVNFSFSFWWSVGEAHNCGDENVVIFFL